jgi:hypothetical protein
MAKTRLPAGQEVWRVILHYLKLFGRVNNFDGAFHNASQNNTLFGYIWTAF